MIVTATELANDSKTVLDRVIATGEAAEIHRHGRSVAEIRSVPGVSRSEFVRLMRGAKLGTAARREMQAAIAAVNEMFGHAGRD